MVWNYRLRILQFNKGKPKYKIKKIKKEGGSLKKSAFSSL